MSYLLSDGVTNLRALFYAYRSTAVSNLPALSNVPFTDVINTSYSSISGGITPYVPNGNTYVVAESRTSGDLQSVFNLVDMEIVENIGSKSEGYQRRSVLSNAVVIMDDGAYGITSNTAMTYRVADAQSQSDFDSNAYETRMIGIVTQ
jgi:hypothetical protein